MKLAKFRDNEVCCLEEIFGKNYYRMLTEVNEGAKSDSHVADIVKSRIIWLKIRGDVERANCLVYGLMASIEGTFVDYCKYLIKKRLKDGHRK